MPTHIAPALALQAITEGSLTWSPATKQLLLVSSGSSEFQIYSPFGRLDSVRQRIDSDFSPVDARGPLFGTFQRDSLLRVVALGSGDLVVFVNKQRESGSRSFLEILRLTSQALSVVDTGISISGNGGFGFLVGADQEGALYFARGNPDLGANLIKARLVRQ